MTLNEKLKSVIQAHKMEPEEIKANGTIVLLSEGPKADVTFISGVGYNLVASLTKAIIESESLRDVVYSVVAVSLKHKPNPQFIETLEEYLKDERK